MLNKKMLTALQEYVDNHLECSNFVRCETPLYTEKEISENIPQNELDDFIKTTRQPTFNQVLFSFIDKTGARDTEVYKKAGLDRRHFSKIRSNPEYRPGKNSVISLAMALELNKKEADKLLSAAGYSLSESDTFDLVIQFCLEKRIYDLHSINQALDYFSLKPLAGALE
ncbi:hypothetical protein [Dethiobacter alkaliphilus]|uniref:Appr-1-p processing domain protein n=1 Tax=Dethiobacter alkaliphilus AHT 1 TaxID=555088 RepID=C0GCF6_DETAL|nr:hypothetical protein [Dethiobacter alkaliphilus]EEG78891.1 hypothetical protein DealDRAFT_0165 [Dethiobacter alkaliphilus AHT 1]